jgi:hypothetical protein
MGCRSDYMEPTAEEAYSKKVAEMIVYACGALNGAVVSWIKEASTSQYGAPKRHNELTDILCNLCSNMSEEQKNNIIYDGHNANARKLAEWWDNHQKVDSERLARKDRVKEMLKVGEAILSRLSKEEREALKFTINFDPIKGVEGYAR